MVYMKFYLRENIFNVCVKKTNSEPYTVFFYGKRFHNCHIHGHLSPRVQVEKTRWFLRIRGTRLHIYLECIEIDKLALNKSLLWYDGQSPGIIVSCEQRCFSDKLCLITLSFYEIMGISPLSLLNICLQQT